MYRFSKTEFIKWNIQTQVMVSHVKVFDVSLTNNAQPSTLTWKWLFTPIKGVNMVFHSYFLYMHNQRNHISNSCLPPKVHF